MKKYRILNITGAVLEKYQLEKYLEKLASDHILKEKSDKDTYPIPRMKENFEIITEVYDLLNEHIKLKIPIHPAGEWLLDNYYVVEETVKMAEKELTLKKYTNFLGLHGGSHNGFKRRSDTQTRPAGIPVTPTAGCCRFRKPVCHAAVLLIE